MKALEMDFWRRACGVSRLEHVRNDEIRRKVHRNKDIMDTINMKRLIWYGHVQKMPEERWPKRMLDWVPNRRRKRGRPRRGWRENIHLEMERRNLDPGTERIGKHGRQDAENGASCNKAAVYIKNNYTHLKKNFIIGDLQRK